MVLFLTNHVNNCCRQQEYLDSCLLNTMLPSSVKSLLKRKQSRSKIGTFLYDTSLCPFYKLY
jgi:hypothetical protein